MKLIRYYGKARNFNSTGCVMKRENSDKSSFSNLNSAAFKMIFFTLGMAPQSISSQYYGKTAFFVSGTFTLHTYLKYEASFWISRSSRPECFVKAVFLEISHTRKHLCQRQRSATLLKKRFWHRCFPVNFAKLLKTLFFTEHLRCVLLN